MTQTINTMWQEIDAALKRDKKTQEWLAGELGLSNNAITKWKRTGQISRENAIRVSKLLSIPLDKLLVGKEDVFQEVLESLPFDRSKPLLTNFMFQIQHAEDVLSGDQITRYTKMIQDIIKDMERRKKSARRA